MLKGEKGAFAWEWSDKGRFTCYTYRPFRTRTVLIGARIEKIAERIVIEVFACVCPSDIVGDNIFAERTIVLKSTWSNSDLILKYCDIYRTCDIPNIDETLFRHLY